MYKKSTILRRFSKRNHTRFNIILTIFLILPFSLALLSPVGRTEPLIQPDQMTLEKTVSTSFASPGEKLNFTITYSNPTSETAYNVTIFETMPADLTFITSKPFYDGASDPETGFYRWSRGNIPPGQSGTVVVKAMVNNVPVGTVITNTAHLTYENGITVEVTSSVDVTVTQAAGVEVLPDQIHSVAPHTNAYTVYNVTITNTGNGLDTFNISLLSVAYNPSGATHDWKIELYNSTGYSQKKPMATVYDSNSEDPSSWTDHGVVAEATLASEESTWYIVKVIEAEGTSGSGDAYLNVQLVATSTFDPNISDIAGETTIVKSVAGLTLAPDYLRYANPGETMVYRHILVNSGQTEVIDLDYTSPNGWTYTFCSDNGTALTDTDGSGHVDIGVLPKNAYTYVVVKMTVPYSTPAGVNETALITARGVTSGNYDTVNDTTIVKSAPVLGVDKTLVSENPAYQGDTVTYTISITNLGNTKLATIPLDDAFETLSLDFSNADPAEDEHDETAGTIRWGNLTALEPGQTVVVTVNFVATAADSSVRQSANVIDAEDEFGNSISAIHINRELTIIGTHTLTVTVSPDEAIGGSFSATWTEHGIQKEGTFATAKSITCDQDTIAAVSSPQTPINNGNVRYVFNSYSPSSTVTMDSDKTVTINYQTEYTLTFEQIGSGEPVYITVNGAQLPSALPQSLWVTQGSTAVFSYPSIIAESAGTTRYVLTGVSGNTTDTSVVVNAPTSVKGSYKTQYYLAVITEPEALGTPQYSGWYDSGTYADIEVEALTGGDGVSTRYRFDHWTGTSIIDTASSSTQIMMDAPKIATAHFVKQYYITVISLHDSPTPSQWVDNGDSLSASVTSPTEIATAQTQWRCVGFNVDGEIKPGASYTFADIQAPHIIEFQWVQQFWLQVDTTINDATVEGTGWYDIGTQARVSATTPYQPSATHRFVFTSWTSTGPNEALIADPAQSSTAVTMNNYYTVQVDWQEQWYITVISPHGSPTPSQWVNTSGSLVISVTSPADDTGAGTRYRCIGYKIDEAILQEGIGYTFTDVQSAHKIEFEWVAQFYLTMTTNFGAVSPDSGWYDAGSIVTIEATAPATVEGGGYVWHGWTGISEGSYSGSENPTAITVRSPITETAYWKIQPLVTITILSDTVANGDRIVVEGETQPIQPGIEILVTYTLPNGTRIDHIVFTDHDGIFQDTLLIDEGYIYNLFADDGLWQVAASRQSDASHENAEASTMMRIQARSESQIHPILMAGAIIAIGLVAYVPPVKKFRNGKNWRRISVALSLTGLVLAAVSLGLNWVSVAGTVTIANTPYEVSILLYPLQSGSVSITGLQYTGAEIPSMVNPSLQSVKGSAGPILAIYLIPIACALALTNLYRPKNSRQRKLKISILIISGLLMVTSVIHTFVFVQGQANIIEGAGVSYGLGAYIAVISGALTLLSGLFAIRENHNNSNKTKTY